MPTALAAIDTADAPRTTRWTACLPMLLLGVNFQASMGSVLLDLRPTYLLPLMAAWWARRDGLVVALPLALLTLMPEMSWRIGFVTVGFGFPKVACLLSVGVAIASSRGIGAVSIAAAWRRPWTSAGLVAMVLWAFAAGENARLAARINGVEFALDALAAPAMLMILLAVDWRRVAQAFGKRASNAALLLAVLVTAALSMHLALSNGSLWMRLGSASASSLLPAAAFVIVLCGWARWWRVILLLGAAALLGELTVSTIGSIGDRVLGARAFPAPWTAFVNGSAAALMGAAFLEWRAPTVRPSGPALRAQALVALAMFGIVVLSPALDRGAVSPWGTSLWSMAAVAFLGGRFLGGRGAIGVPLALLAAVEAMAVAVDPRLNAQAMTSGLPTLAGVMLAYGLGGWLARRQDDMAVRAGPGQGSQRGVDISAVARVVQQVDNAATMRAFWALLVPALVLWQLIGLGLVVDLGLRAFGDDAEFTDWMTIAGLMSVLVLWPLGFVLFDWIDRQDRLRVLSALAAALLAWVGAAALAIGLGAGLSAALEDGPVFLRAAAVGLLLVSIGAVGLWLLGRSRGARIGARVLGAVLGLAALAALLALGNLVIQEAGDYLPLLQLAAMVLVAALLAASWVRAIRLRLVLAEDHPRALLFGALPPGRFSVRMAALLGLPSLMWTRGALRQWPAWAFLLARPMVYVGAALLKSTLPIGMLALASGHALFTWGKRGAAATPWQPQNDAADPRAPVLFLRSFEDDQFDFQRPPWQLRLRWFDLWSFRRNVDEAMVDEVAQYGPVVALGRPGESAAPFGAWRHYATHADWQDVVESTARRARAIVLVAGDSPGLRWEFDLVRREDLLERTVLLFHPDPARAASTRRALIWLLDDEGHVDRLLAAGTGVPVAWLHTANGPFLLRADRPSAAAYVVALRTHFQHVTVEALVSVID